MSTEAFIEEFFSDVDQTLERLIENAEMLEEIESFPNEFGHEIESLKSLQESLINHLLNLNELMEKDSIDPYTNEELREKVIRYSELDKSILPKLSQQFHIDHDQLKLRKARSRRKAFIER